MNIKLIFLGIYGLVLILFGMFILIKPEIVAYLIGILFIFAGINAILVFFLYILKGFWEKSDKEDVVVGDYKVIDKEE